MPVFNGEKTIFLPLRSLFYQNFSFDKMELILSDDGSQDRTLPIAREILRHASFHWSILENPHSGVSAARNLGIAHAHGEYVFFLDADDELPTDFFSTTLQEADAEKADLSWVWKIEKDNEIPHLKKHPMNQLADGLNCLNAYLKEPKNGQVIVRRSFLESSGIRYTEGLAYAEDFDFFVRLLLKARRVHVEDRTFYLYRKHPFQVTRTIDRIESRKATWATFHRLYTLLSKNDVPLSVLIKMKRQEVQARIRLLKETRRRDRKNLFHQLMETEETREALRYAEDGLVSLKWRLRLKFLITLDHWKL